LATIAVEISDPEAKRGVADGKSQSRIKAQCVSMKGRQ
jgi:hypothetical protein